ncbi:hypothetical protein BLNAU_22515 [Blattamonas nauphoetae]|uniref:Uncharacterized protein n=1 Tax=Blattamonas nauphoetae TaxID=2049346 RepID=A0ABQ9WSV5_9EUKA|nr:hypothetical protein BLNAU_22515 [Blattamonas nauphoetae]
MEKNKGSIGRTDARTHQTGMDVRERRKKSEKERKEAEEAKRWKCTTPLPHFSPPVSLAADDTQCRFSSLSPTTPQLMTRCSLPPRQIHPNRTRWKDEIAVG